VNTSWTTVQFIHKAWLAVLAIAIGLLSQSVWAEDGFERNIQYLKRNGIERLGGQSVDDLMEKGRKIPVRIKESVNFESADGYSRRSAKWNEDGIELSEQHLSRISSKNEDGLVTHEKCQRMTQGACDQNFQNTGLIEGYKSFENLRKSRPDLKFPDVPLKTFEKDLVKKGGVTAVDGGGDARLLDYMRAIYLDLIISVARGRITMDTFHSIHDWFTQIRVEIDPSLPQGRVWFDKETETLSIPKDAFINANFDANLDMLLVFVGRLVQKFGSQVQP